jgi:hypothetical protein
MNTYNSFNELVASQSVTPMQSQISVFNSLYDVSKAVHTFGKGEHWNKQNRNALFETMLKEYNAGASNDAIKKAMIAGGMHPVTAISVLDEFERWGLDNGKIDPESATVLKRFNEK